MPLSYLFALTKAAFALCFMANVISSQLAAANPHQPPSTKPSNMARTASGVKFPNHELTDHEGRKLHFYDDLVKDKIVLINFIFTSCDLTCPMETARLKQVQEIIGDRLGKDIFFYSVSIDPETDTPQVLNDYRKRFGVKDGWSFLTGKESDITQMRKKLGLFIEGFEKTKSDHTVNMLVGNEKTGQWMRRSNMDKAEVIANILTENLSEWRYTAGVTHDYANAPLHIEPMKKGEEIFKTRCTDCHTIGGGDGLGPDLMNITKIRDTEWLKSWIVAPNKVLASKDPLAKSLLEKFNGLVMPNLGLSETEATDVIEFLQDVKNRK